MEIFNSILFWINNVVFFITGLAFSIQILYVILCFLPYKKFKPAKTKHKFGIIICARNEESVIGDTIKCLLKQNYPKELFDIFVFAHNCTDNTAKIAREAGAIAFELNDTTPEHCRVSYALKYGFEKILAEHDNYDAFIRFDADNVIHPDYITKMNDALDAGYHVARGYNNSKNLTQNVYTGISGIWYLRDCRFSSHSRKALNVNQFLVGSGMMLSSEIVHKDGGWTKAMGLIEDQEFAIKQLYDGYKSTYVKEAIVYEDQPSTFMDTLNRNIRIGKGSWNLFWSDGFKCLGKFFVKWDFSYLDTFLTLFFIPIAVLFCTWFPAYYIYDVIFNICVGNMPYVWMVLKTIGLAIGCAFIIPFIFQALLVVLLERKSIGKQNMKKIWKPILLFPFFMIIYAAGIFLGTITNPKWKQIKRNSVVTMDEIETSTNDATFEDTDDMKEINE